MKTAYMRLITALVVSSASVFRILAAEKTLSIEVRTGKWDRQKSLVALELPAAWRNVKHASLSRIDDGSDIPIQIDYSKSTPAALWILQQPLSKKLYKNTN